MAFKRAAFHSFAVAAIATASACGGTTPLSPVSPETINSVVSVITAPHGASIRPGEVVRLRATALNIDNSTADFTEAAIWASSEKVIKLTGVKAGEVVGVTAGDAKITAACGPVRGDLAASVPSLMRATLSTAAGHASSFTSEAVWGTSDSSIARPGSTNSSLGRVFVQNRDGEVTISASCLGQTGQIRVRIGHFTLSGTVRSATSEVIPEALVGASTRSSGSGSHAMGLVSERQSITVSRVGSETLSAGVTWNQQPATQRDMVMSPLPEIFRQGDGRLCQFPASHLA